MARRSEVAATPVLWFADAVGFVLTLGPVAIAWATATFYVHTVWNARLFWAWALLTPIVAMAALLVTIFLLRIVLPRLREGVFRAGWNLGFFSWFCSLALARALPASGLEYAFHSFYLTRFLYWRAMGAKIAYRVNCSMQVAPGDFGMIEIGEGSTIGTDVQIAGHTFVGDKLLVSRVVIGKNVFIGARSLIGPKTRIDDGAWIGIGSFVAGDHVEAGRRIADFEWQNGNPSSVGLRARTGSPRGEDRGRGEDSA